MKNKFLYIIFSLLFGIVLSCYAQNTVLKGSISKVPLNFFGLWRVNSVQLETDAPTVFKKNGVDYWNISQINDVIYLSNPISGASAEVNINSSGNNHITFSKIGQQNGKILEDNLSITINGETFSGVDELELKTISDINGEIIKTEHAKYSLKGEKVVGN